MESNGFMKEAMGKYQELHEKNRLDTATFKRQIAICRVLLHYPTRFLYISSNVMISAMSPTTSHKM